jgi:hypothetical protein
MDDEVKVGYIKVTGNGSTTTTTTSGGGGSGGGGEITTSTTSTFLSSTSTTTVPIACSTDAECEDGNFCNGTESCVQGFCVSSGNPCDSVKQVCSESFNACVDIQNIKRIEASTALLLHRGEASMRAPVLFPQRSYWLRIEIAEANNVDLKKSLFSVEGPTQNDTGVMIDEQRFRKPHGALLKKNMGRVFWVPVSVSKSATPGTWKIKIETDRTDAANSFMEIVEGKFVVQKKLFQQ